MASSSVEYRLNIRFLGRLLLVAAVAVVGIFFLHRYQEKKLINRYIQQADQAEKDGERGKEIEYLRQYLALEPGDNDKLVRFGMVACKYGKTASQITEGYFALQKALRNNDKLPPDVRMQCIKLAMRPGIDQPFEAKRNLELLYPDRKMTDEAEVYYTEALIRLGEHNAADDFLTKLTLENKTRIDAAMRLAVLKRELTSKSPQAADIVLQTMLEQSDNERNPKAWLRAANYYRRYNAPEKYATAIAKARELAPTDAEVLFGAAEHKLTRWQATWPLSGKPEPNADFDEGIRLLEDSLKALGPMTVPDPLPEPGTPELTRLELGAKIYRTLAGALTDVEQFTEAEKYARELTGKFPDMIWLQVDLLNVLVRQKKYAEARSICSKMSQRGFASAFVELQLGYIDYQQQKYVDAARHLERVVTELANLPDEKRLASLRLAKCYEETGEIDRAIDALRAAVPKNNLDPFWISCNVSLAEMLTRVGRISEAIALYKEVEAKKEPRVLEPLVTLMLAQLQKEPEASRESDLRTYLDKIPPGPRKNVLVSNLLEVKKDASGARQLLLKADKDNPNDPTALINLARMELRDKNLEAAKALVDQASTRFGDIFVVRHLRAMIAVEKGHGDPGLAAELEALAAGADKFLPAERVALFKQLSFGARNIERRDLARKWLKACVSDRGEQDIEIHYALLDLAVLDSDDAEIDRVLDDIARVAGGRDNHTFRLAQAFTLVHKAQKLKDNASERRRFLEQANELLVGLENTRKEWGRLDFAQAMVADMLGNKDQAIIKYQKAIDHGERHPEIFRRYIDLLRVTKRDDLILRLVANYPEANSIITEDPKVLVETKIRNSDFTGAAGLARKAVTESNEDPRKLFWLADVLFRCRLPAESEIVLRKAQRLAPADAEIWTALIQVLVHNKKESEARAFAADTEAKLTSGDAALASARGAMLLNDKAKAKEKYEQLMEKRGDNLHILRAAGDYYFSMERDLGKTRDIMKKILAHPERTPVDTEIARRMLARCVVASHSHMAGLEALGILGYKSPSEAATFKGDESIDDLRARFAVLTVIRGREAREASVLVLRKIEEKTKDFSLDEQLAFGQILFALGQWEECFRRLQTAANAPGDPPVAIALYANALLRRNRLDDAKKQIDRLTAKEPDTQATAELRSRLAVLSDKKHEAAEILTRFANSKDDRVIVAADLLDRLGLPDDAAPLFARAANGSTNWDMKLIQARFLARNGRLDESLQIFEKVWPNLSLEYTVPLLCEAMMHSGDGAASTRVMAGNLIQAAVAKGPHLMPFQAAYFSIIDKVPESISLFQQCLAKNPNDIFSLNNLAFLMAFQQNGQGPALEHIRKAISLVGPLPNFLDTEAFILLKSGKTSDINDAIEKLREVVLDEPSSSAYMHMAQAYLAINQLGAAKDAYRQARQHNLRITDFHPLERPEIRKVIGTLEK